MIKDINQKGKMRFEVVFIEKREKIMLTLYFKEKHLILEFEELIHNISPEIHHALF